MLLSWLRHTSFFTHHLRVLSSAVAWGVGEAISRTRAQRGLSAPAFGLDAAVVLADRGWAGRAGG